MKALDLDLKELMYRVPDSGIIHFMDQRVLLFDALSLGLLRKELIESVGTHMARGILTRFGYAHGWRSAERFRQEAPELFEDSWAGPHLHGLLGLLTPLTNERGSGLNGAPLVQGSWKDSYEAEQHLLHLGIADQQVCWSLTGFASGYVSKRTGRDVYFIETNCCGKGDKTCEIEARYREDWPEEFADQLQYYAMESADSVLTNLTQKLKNIETKLKKRQQQLSNLDHMQELSGITCHSPAMRKAVDTARRIAKVDASVVISGETGVGKERIARLIHDESPRANKPFIAINCGAVTETLLESELFGYSKGAFTGAYKDTAGFFEAVKGGTLFLDEIGEISPGMQVKILRVLQEREIRRVGENQSRNVDFRIVAATNRHLADEVANGNFRQDLYYRLKVIEVKMPPLRERREDIMPLARIFLDETAARSQRKIESFTPKAAEHLLCYAWPGNVRELQNVVEFAVALSHGERIDLEDLPEELNQPCQPKATTGEILPLEEVEKQYILSVLNSCAGNKSKTAEYLNIGIATLYRKLNSYGLSS